MSEVIEPDAFPPDRGIFLSLNAKPGLNGYQQTFAGYG